MSSNQQKLSSIGSNLVKDKVPIKVYNHKVIEQHPKDQKYQQRMTEIKWMLDALQIHARLQPTETIEGKNLLRELDRDYGMFPRKNKMLHMRNLNNQLSLQDVVGFHEIIGQ